jgi:cobalamin synthase
MSVFTKIPLEPSIEFDEGDYKLGMIFLPIVGIIVGIVLSILKLTNFISSVYLTGLILTVLYIFMAGFINMEGFGKVVNKFFESENENNKAELNNTGKIIGILLLLIAYIFLLGENSFSAVFLMPVVGKSAYMLSCFLIKNKQDEIKNKFIYVSDKSVRNSAFLFSFVIGLIINYMSVIPIFTALVFTGFITKLMIREERNFGEDELGFTTEISQIIFLIASYYII